MMILNHFFRNQKLEKLENNAGISIFYFECTWMKMTHGKSHLLISRNEHEHVWVKVRIDTIRESKV